MRTEQINLIDNRGLILPAHIPTPNYKYREIEMDLMMKRRLGRKPDPNKPKKEPGDAIIIFFTIIGMTGGGIGLGILGYKVEFIGIVIGTIAGVILGGIAGTLIGNQIKKCLNRKDSGDRLKPGY